MKRPRKAGGATVTAGPGAPAVTTGRDRVKKGGEIYPRSLATAGSAGMVGLLWMFSTAQNRGSGWAALALGCRLALGATTSTFAYHQAHEQEFVGLFFSSRVQRGLLENAARPQLEAAPGRRRHAADLGLALRVDEHA